MILNCVKGSVMKRSIISFLFGTFSLSAMAAPLGSVSKAVIPADVQQIINVDYRSMQNSPSAQALKAKVLPDQLKQFETALKGAGINPETDVEQLTFASFRVKDKPLHVIGVASGAFALPKVNARLKAKKVKYELYRKTRIYPMGASGLSMSLLDDFTMLFGEGTAVKLALDARDSEIPSLTTNSAFTDMIASVESDAIWSVLDAPGTQNMMKSALGEAAQLADYDMIKSRLKGSRYRMDFNNGVKFNLDVTTSDSMTAATLSSLLKAGMMYKKMNASAVEKSAMENLKVDSDSKDLKLIFESDDKKFISLVNSDLFAAVSR
jgi:hypothetical protein